MRIHPETGGQAGPRAGRQRGVVLPVTLVVLAAMTLASLALVRSVDTATRIAGNLAFKQSGIASGDAGIGAARAWLDANAGLLEEDVPSAGYYATSQDCLDLTGNGKLPRKCTPPFTAFDWDAGSAVSLPMDEAGNEVSYLIQRLCDTAGPLDGARCTVSETRPGGKSLGSTRQMAGYRPASWELVNNRGYYRITARISGTRRSTSYVQAIVHR